MSKQKYILNADFIKNEISKGTTITNIAKIYGCSSWVIFNFCKKNNIDTPKRLKNLVNTEFGFFIVRSCLGQTGEGKGKRTWWNCECKCGNFKKLSTGEINAKKRLSCGKCLYTNENIKNLNLCNWKGYKDISGTYFKSLYNGAISRNQEFKINIEEIWNLFIQQNKKCKLSGLDITLIPTYSKLKYQTASLDRIDSSKGYIISNVQWVHKDINRMKQHFDEKYFLELCSIISKYNKYYD